MISFRFMLATTFIVSLILARSYAWTWFPDPQRAVKLEARWNVYKSLHEKTRTAVEGVCGKLMNPTCRRIIGRPSDSETESCDKACCHAGFLTGFCQSNVNAEIILNVDGSTGQTQYRPTINPQAGCRCTNDLRDAKCGPDGSLLGIRCPFDRSACARKCCRDGKSGGRCGGFLKTKCKCD